MTHSVHCCNALNISIMCHVGSDPGIFARGAQARKQLRQLFLFFSPQLILQWFINGLLKKKTIIYKVSERVQHFPGGPTFSRGGGGPNANFYRNP